MAWGNSFVSDPRAQSHPVNFRERLRFDAYHACLRIAPNDLPPNHYRLLGVDLYDDTPDTIQHPADRHMPHPMPSPWPNSSLELPLLARHNPILRGSLSTDAL
jgi:hypothetical protein